MSPAQIKLLRLAIEYSYEDRRDDRLIEVGSINGVNKRTADTLVNAGLLVYEYPTWANEHTSEHVRLIRPSDTES